MAKDDIIHKTKVHNVFHCHQRKTKPWPRKTCTENFVKFGCIVFETWKQTDRQTYLHAHCTTLHPYQWRSNQEQGRASLVRKQNYRANDSHHMNQHHSPSNLRVPMCLQVSLSKDIEAIWAQFPLTSGTCPPQSKPCNSTTILTQMHKVFSSSLSAKGRSTFMTAGKNHLPSPTVSHIIGLLLYASKPSEHICCRHSTDGEDNIGSQCQCASDIRHQSLPPGCPRTCQS